MGPEPCQNLPFKCRMVADAAQDDLEIPPAKATKDGKCDVMFPVFFPDEGSFEWLDGFLQENPDYVELSGRKIQDWAAQSGMKKPKSAQLIKTSNDNQSSTLGSQAWTTRVSKKCSTP